MTVTEALLKALDDAHWELSEAFLDFPSEDLWRRPHPKLLSVGELAAHIAYGEAANILGGELDSPLVQRKPDYYPRIIENGFELEFTPESLLAQVQRVHERCKSAFLTAGHHLAEKNPYRADWSWQYTLEYMAFHAAYHTGQIYSVRHLLGHETPDN